MFRGTQRLAKLTSKVTKSTNLFPKSFRALCLPLSPRGRFSQLFSPFLSIKKTVFSINKPAFWLHFIAKDQHFASEE